MKIIRGLGILIGCLELLLQLDHLPFKPRQLRNSGIIMLLDLLQLLDNLLVSNLGLE